MGGADGGPHTLRTEVRTLQEECTFKDVGDFRAISDDMDLPAAQGVSLKVDWRCGIQFFVAAEVVRWLKEIPLGDGVNRGKRQGS